MNDLPKIQKFHEHNEYAQSLPRWRLCRLFAEGEDAVKAASRSDKIVPVPSGMSDAQYLAYLERGLLYGAVDRTIAGFTGAAFRNPPMVNGAEREALGLDSLGEGSEEFEQLLAKSVEEVLTVGRVGHLVDAATEENAPPYVSKYRSESIINWQTKTINGRQQLSKVVLKEIRTEAVDISMETATIIFYRILRLGNIVKDWGAFAGVQEVEGWEGVEGQYYYQELWLPVVEADGTVKQDEWRLSKFVIPRRVGGGELEEIPFVFTNSVGNGPDVQKPPLLDLVFANRSHFRTSVDLEHGRHFTALPTPWITGLTPEEQKQRYTIGSGVAWTFTEEKARLGMLEFTGNGLGHLAKGLEEKEKLMAVLGARLLEQQKAGVETADALRQRTAGDTATLTTIVNSIQASWSKLLRWVWHWGSVTELREELSVQMTSEFNPTGMDAAQISALMELYLENKISYSTLFHNLQRGDVIPRGRTEEEEKKRILQEKEDDFSNISEPIGKSKELPPPFEKDPPEDEA